jgi:hypothetical protein
MYANDTINPMVLAVALGNFWRYRKYANAGTALVAE